MSFCKKSRAFKFLNAACKKPGSFRALSSQAKSGSVELINKFER